MHLYICVDLYTYKYICKQKKEVKVRKSKKSETVQ